MASIRQIGPFEVLDKLGAGGMGEVFKARDNRLNRFVALKFLPEAASDAARERFQREAMAIAALNHPHICTLYEVGDDGGRPYLVLELLEGETLKARLRRGALDNDLLLDWSVQISDALDAAHRKGVLHRDLKPENIWVAPGGHIKVLDFGLARLEADAGGAETMTSPVPLTSPGVAMGTFPYMSPEQAKGEPLDARSDIFSFGSVFYEMASGHAAFGAASAAEVMAGILKGQPKKLSQVRPNVAPMVEQVAERCLEKEPDLRFQSAADLRSELKRVKRETSTGTMAAAVPLRLRRRPAWFWPAAAAVLIAAAGAGWWRFRPTSAAPVHLQFRQLTFNGHVVDAAISPDGKFLAHVDVGPQGTSLHLLSISSGSDVEIMPPAPGCCQSPSFSPDGGQVYFLENRTLLSVPVLGGAVRTIVPAACSGAGFSPDGSQISYVAYPTSAPPIFNLMVAQPDGSQSRVLHQLPAGNGYYSQCWSGGFGPTHAPAWSPDGRWIATTVYPVNGGGHVNLTSVASGQAHNLGSVMTAAVADLNWLPDSSGLLLSASIPDSAAPQIWELSISSGRLTQLTSDLQGYTEASLSAAGQLAVVHAAPQASIWVQDRAGGEFRQVPGGGANQDGHDGVAWTPQGNLVSLRNLGGKWQIWTQKPNGSAAHPLLAAGLPDSPYDLQVAPNGQIVFGSNSATASIWRVDADGTGLVELVRLPAGAVAYGPTLLRHGTEVGFMEVAANSHQTLQSVPLAGGAPHQLWAAQIFAPGAAATLDGTKVVVTTLGSQPGSRIAVILRLDGGQPQVTPVALDPKSTPGPYGWTADGSAIVYAQHQGTTDNLWALPVSGGKPYLLTHFQDLNIFSGAISRDGRLALSRGFQNSDAVLATGLTGSGSHGR